MTVAVLWAVYAETKSALALSAVTVLQTVAFIFSSIYIGAKLDQLDTKKYMILAHLSSGIIVFLLAFSWHFEFYRLGFLYLFVFLLAATSAVVPSSYQIVIKKIVDERDLVTANSWLVMGRDISNLVGLLLGGSIVAILGTTFAFVGNAISFVLAAILVLFARIPFIPPKKEKETVGLIKEMISYLWHSNVLLKQSLWYVVMINFVLTPINMLMTMISERSSFQSMGLGIMAGCLALGSLTGALFSRKVADRFQHISIIPILITLAALFSFLPVVLSHLWLIGLIPLYFCGICLSLSLIISNTFFTKNTDTDMMGRISSFRSIAVRVPPPLVSVMFGALVSLLGITAATLIVQLTGATLSFAILLWYRKRVENPSNV